MKKFLLITLLCLPFLSHADHGAGVDIFYNHLHDSTYRISVIIYGNCTDRTDYLKLFTLNPQVDVYDGTTKKSTMELNIINDSTKNASPYCVKQQDSTSCIYPSSSIQGFTRIYYTDTITLPYKSANWLFRFNGSMKTGCQSRLGRPGALSNYVTNPTGASNNMTVDATLNNLQGNNNSASSFFSTIPLYCINVPGVFTQQTTDPDHDSLVYQVITPKNLNSNCTSPTNLVPVNGYNPLHVVAGSYSFSTTTGRMTFIPDISQISIVAMRISEYRNGVLVGTVERERIFKILATCNNQPPLSHIDTTSAALTGATVLGRDTLITCPGNLVKFNVPVTNPYGDTVKATAEQILSGSNVLISRNNTPSPLVNFTWNTAGVANGTYTFSVRYVTNSCPLPSSSLSLYTVIVGGAGDITTTQLSATNCVRKASIKFELKNGRPPYQAYITQNSDTVKTYTSTTGLVTDSLEAGNYHIRLFSNGLPCVSDVDFTVVDSGKYPYPPVATSPVDYCRKFTEAVPLIAKGDTVATLRWYDPSGNYTAAAPTPSTQTGGTFIYTVTQQYKSCESDADTIRVNISADECDYEPNVHNVITPNGDGKNDQWVISNINYYPKAVIQLYDKLGDKVFETTNYKNDFNGNDLPSGLYYYLIQLNGVNKTSGKELYKGYLMIKR